mgnify:CR=1 FL=1
MTKRVGKMRIKCPCCNGKAAIYSRPTVTDDVANIYAKCRNQGCERFDQAFVSQLAFSHWIDPKAEALQMTLSFLLDQLPVNQRRQVLAQYQ